MRSGFHVYDSPFLTVELNLGEKNRSFFTHHTPGVWPSSIQGRRRVTRAFSAAPHSSHILFFSGLLYGFMKQISHAGDHYLKFPKENDEHFAIMNMIT